MRVNQSTSCGYSVRAIGYTLICNCITEMIKHSSRASGVTVEPALHHMEPAGLRQSHRDEEREQQGPSNII